MVFIDLAKKRYSSRKYDEKAVDDILINQILETARVAPTAANKQPFHLIVLKTKSSIEKLSKAGNTFGAPAAIIVCGSKAQAWTRPYDNANTAIVDASIITDHMMLACTDLGLGSVWIYRFDPAIVKAEFNISEEFEPIHILLFGYSIDDVKSPDRHDKVRKSVNELVTYETFR